MRFQPKKTVVLVIVFCLIIALCIPFLIYKQDSNGQPLSELSTKTLIKIFFIPAFFSFAVARAVYILKIIEINADTWKVRYVFPFRKVEFRAADIESVHKFNYLTYKHRIPVTTYTIRLKNSRKIKISSNEITDFDKLKRILNRKEYPAIQKRRN